MKDVTVPWRISGSRALAEACRAAGPNLSAFVDGACREALARAGAEVPAPLPPKRNGPKAKRRKRAST